MPFGNSCETRFAATSTEFADKLGGLNTNFDTKVLAED
jgi:hypothetical protein